MVLAAKTNLPWSRREHRNLLGAHHTIRQFTLLSVLFEPLTSTFISSLTLRVKSLELEHEPGLILSVSTWNDTSLVFPSAQCEDDAGGNSPALYGPALKPESVRLTGGFVKTVEKKVERTVCCLVPAHGVTSHHHPILDKLRQFLLSVPHTRSVSLCNFLCCSLFTLTNQKEEPPGFKFSLSALRPQRLDDGRIVSLTKISRRECRAQLVSPASTFLFADY